MNRFDPKRAAIDIAKIEEALEKNTRYLIYINLLIYYRIYFGVKNIFS